MKKKVVSMLVVVCTVLSLISISTVVAASTVRVTIPTFNVTLNGVSINNTYAEYPLIVYNDITYVPMTWGYSRFLGLATSWDPRNRDFSVWMDCERSSDPGIINASYPNNAYSYVATVADYNIYINQGNRMSNKGKEYPLLNFRDITYFPLTWEYAVEEFGWNYSFTNYGGLNIALDMNNPFVNPSLAVGEWETSFLQYANSVETRIKITSVDQNTRTVFMKYKVDEESLRAFGGLIKDTTIDDYSYGSTIALKYSAKKCYDGMALVTEPFTIPDATSKYTIVISSNGKISLGLNSGEPYKEMKRR